MKRYNDYDAYEIARMKKIDAKLTEYAKGNGFIPLGLDRDFSDQEIRDSLRRLDAR